jgi:hypothetical protein
MDNCKSVPTEDNGKSGMTGRKPSLRSNIVMKTTTSTLACTAMNGFASRIPTKLSCHAHFVDRFRSLIDEIPQKERTRLQLTAAMNKAIKQSSVTYIKTLGNMFTNLLTHISSFNVNVILAEL